MRTVLIPGMGQLETCFAIVIVVLLVCDRGQPQMHVILLLQPPKFCIIDMCHYALFGDFF